MEILKWELLERFEEQGEQQARVRTRYNEKVTEQEEKIKELNYKYEELIRKELFSDVDLKEEKKAVRQEIEQASKELEVIREESIKAIIFIRQGEVIKPLDLIKDWNDNYSSSVRNEQLKKVQDQLEAARASFLNALVDYYELEKTYHSEYVTLHERFRGTRNERGEYVSPQPLVSLRDLKLINDTELSEVRWSKLPSDVERKSVFQGGRK